MPNLVAYSFRVAVLVAAAALAVVAATLSLAPVRGFLLQSDFAKVLTPLGLTAAVLFLIFAGAFFVAFFVMSTREHRHYRWSNVEARH